MLTSSSLSHDNQYTYNGDWHNNLNEKWKKQKKNTNV